MHIRSEYAGNGKHRMQRRNDVDMLKFSLQINDQNVVTEGPSRRKKNESMDVSLRKQQLLPQGQVMTAKVKGLLKGLRYISQIFETIEKEPEMQIGYPTDVKHVAHIGCDGPSVSSPAWMNEFRSVPDFSTTPLTTLEALTGKDLPLDPSPTTNPSQSYKDSSSRRPEVDSPAVPRQTRRHHSHAAPGPAAGDEPAPRRRESRRNHSCGESPEPPRRHRRNQGAGAEGSPRKGAGGDGGAAGNPSRRRRSKLGEGGSRSLETNVSDAEKVPALGTMSEERVDSRLRIENLINN